MEGNRGKESTKQNLAEAVAIEVCNYPQAMLATVRCSHIDHTRNKPETHKEDQAS